MSKKRTGATANDSVELSEIRLQRFGLDVALNAYYTFLNYAPFSEEGNRVEGSIVQVARLDAWIATVATCLIERERRGYHRQKIYADTYKSRETAAIRQVVGRASSFLKSRHTDKIYFAPAQFNSNFVVQQNRAFVGKEKCATQGISSSFDKQVLIAVHEK